jgi:hypothetical protein
MNEKRKRLLRKKQKALEAATNEYALILTLLGIPHNNLWYEGQNRLIEANHWFELALSAGLNEEEERP